MIMKYLIIGASFLSLLQTQALIFPQTSSSYNYNQNNISLDDAWTAGDRIGYFNTGFLCVPIGPRHFLAVNHILPVPTNVTYRGVSYPIQSSTTVTQGGGYDLMVHETYSVIPDYAKLQTAGATNGHTYRVYGKGGNPGALPVYGSGAVRGWTKGSNGFGNTQWGDALNISSSSSYIQWYMTGAQTNSFATIWGDSSSPVFKNGVLYGLIQVGSGGRDLTNHPSGCGNQTYVFNTNGLTKCPSATAVALTQNYVNLIPRDILLDYYAAQPRRIAATTASVSGWTAYAFDEIAGWDPTNFTSTATINTDDVIDPAPQDVYKTIKWYSGSGTNILRWSVSDLNIHEKYKVRVHMSSLIATGIIYPSQVIQSVAVTDASGQTTSNNIRPYWDGYNRASVVEFTNLTANASNTISGSVSVDTANGGTYAVISGVEVIRTP